MTRSAAAVVTSTPTLALRSSEWLLCGFFVLAAAWNARRPGFLTIDLLVVFALIAIAQVERATQARALGFARDWIPLGLLLVGYWSTSSVAGTSDGSFERLWIGFDRMLLSDAGLKRIIEVTPLLAGSLEFAYLLTYTIPPFCIAALYFAGCRTATDRFLVIFLAGSLLTYLVLPLSPSISPRLRYPGDLAASQTAASRINVWILDHANRETSVFPSGHVATAISAALALAAAAPRLRRTALALLALAGLIAIATIYGRYHYAVDVGAAIGLSLLAYAISRRLTQERAAGVPIACPAR